MFLTVYCSIILKTETYCDLEVGPLDQISQRGELMVYKHDRFWACMDTIRDTEHLNSLWDSNQAEWKVW